MLAGAEALLAAVIGNWIGGSITPSHGGSWAIWIFAVASVGAIALLSCLLGCACGVALGCWCGRPGPWGPPPGVVGAATAALPVAGPVQLARRLAEYKLA